MAPIVPRARALAIGAAFLIAACGDPYRLTVEALPTPAGPGAAEPFVSVDRYGRAHLSWIERAPDTTATLYVASLNDDQQGWSKPNVVVSRKDLFVNWADFPSVTPLADDRLLAHWLQRNGAGKYAYDVVLAESLDGGATWGPTSLPHDPNVEGEHGFVSVLPTRGEGAYVSLLDGSAGARAAKAASTKQHDAAAHGEGGPMQLGSATWREGAIASRAIVDERVCDCCQTAMAMTTRGPVLVYRDRSDDEIRDMSVVRLVNGAWTAPKTLHADGWKIDFCPVNGPAISTAADTVAITWFTAADSLPRVQVAFSTDAGANFAPPVRIDSGVPAGRVDIEMIDGDAALVTWLQSTSGQDAEVWARVVRRDGTLGQPRIVSPTSGARSSGFPRMARTRDGVVLAWTIPGDTGTVRVAAVRVGGR